ATRARSSSDRSERRGSAQAAAAMQARSAHRQVIRNMVPGPRLSAKNRARIVETFGTLEDDAFETENLAGAPEDFRLGDERVYGGLNKGVSLDISRCDHLVIGLACLRPLSQGLKRCEAGFDPRLDFPGKVRVNACELV